MSDTKEALEKLEVILRDLPLQPMSANERALVECLAILGRGLVVVTQRVEHLEAGAR